MSVVALGETMIRLSPSRGDLMANAQSLELTIGGAESNVAVALASLGIRSRWLGALPQNALGTRVAAELTGAGVDLTHVTWRDHGRVGLYFLEIAVPPRPATVLYDRSQSAMTTMTGDDLDASAFDGAGYAVVSGITSALQPSGAALAEAFLAKAREHGCRRVVDINFRSRLWSAARAAPVLRSLAAQSDTLFCSAADGRDVLGVEGTDAELPEAIRSAIAPQADLIIVTLGHRGAVASARGEFLEARAEAVEQVDPVGAGDALVAGVLYGQISGDTPAEALRAGVALAGIACTIRGDHARIDRATLEAVLARTSPKGLR
jgi:2-dehydro-3-deoxygluconokinase